MRSVRSYFLPIILAVYSDITRKVDGFRAESLDGMPRNQWTTCSGMTGRLGSEYALKSHGYKMVTVKGGPRCAGHLLSSFLESAFLMTATIMLVTTGN